MKNAVVTILGMVAGLVFALILIFFVRHDILISPFSNSPEKPQALKKYTFPELRQTSLPASNISITKKIDINTDPPTYQFMFHDNAKKVSGVLMLPPEPGTYPVIVLFRGYVDKEIYSPGVGTKRFAEYLARAGYITLAPDFLGYGNSDMPSFDFFEARFQTYTTALTLLKSLDTTNDALAQKKLNYTLDTSKVGFWGHSNGGHVALSVLAITGQPYPTVLWAPVTKGFPDSVLTFADEMDDGGKLIRSEVNKLKKNYTIDHFNPASYYRWIDAPIQLHQGMADDAVPVAWSDDFIKNMKKMNKEVEYYTYPKDDHNLKIHWGTAAKRSEEWFAKNL